MKKNFSIIALSLFMAASFSSCQKCEMCYFEYTSISGEVKQLEASEYCGSDLDDIEGAANVGGIDGEYICE